jgi:hypothetical protein
MILAFLSASIGLVAVFLLRLDAARRCPGRGSTFCSATAA